MLWIALFMLTIKAHFLLPYKPQRLHPNGPGCEAIAKFGNFSKKGGTRPPSPREVNSRGSSPAVGRFAPSGLPSLFPRLIEMIRESAQF